MNSIHLHVCRTCLEYEILFDRSNARKEYDVCDKCKSKKIDYIKENRQPVWYEYNADGSKVCDDNNIPIAQYHIPKELSNLTMAEKLLIRRCCPFIPSVHLKEGILGIKGHCICFPQDVNEVCTILPQLKCQVVKYIREIGNTDSSRHRWEMLRVNRGRVLRALRWLKIHNSEYGDIVIDETKRKLTSDEKINLAMPSGVAAYNIGGLFGLKETNGKTSTLFRNIQKKCISTN